MGTVSRPYSLPGAVRVILDEVTKQVRQNSAAPVLLGISGIDCSGKSTLAEAILNRASNAGIRSELVCVDEFIIPNAQRERKGRVHVDYFENTFDHKEFVNHIRRIAANPGVQLVIGEGVYLLRRELVEMWHLKVWLEMPAEQSVTRGAVRDADYFGSPEKSKNEYLRRFVPAHDYHVERDSPAEAADFVFDVQLEN